MSLVTTFWEGIFLETNPGGIPVALFTVGGIFALSYALTDDFCVSDKAID